MSWRGRALALARITLGIAARRCVDARLGQLHGWWRTKRLILLVDGRMVRRGGELAEKQVRGQDIARLEASLYVSKQAPQVREHTRRELVDEKCAAWLQHVFAFSQDVLTHMGRHGAERNAGDDVARRAMTVFAKNLLDVFRRALHHRKPLVRVGLAQKVDELR